MIRTTRRATPVTPSQPIILDKWVRPKINGEWSRGWCEDDNVFVIAGGPSARDLDFGLIKKKKNTKIICVNRAARFVDCDVVAMIDRPMVDEFQATGELDKFKHIITGNYSGLSSSDRVTVVRLNNDLNTTDPSAPMLGRASSTLLAISCALVGQAKNVLVIGLDCGYRNNDGLTDHHWYATPQSVRDESSYINTARVYARFLPTGKVFNLSYRSNENSLPKITYEQALGICDD